MARPVLLPEPFSGESGISRWDDWIEHFEDCAAVNKWDSDEEKLKWIRVRLTGKAHTAYRRLAQDARTKYGECKDALRRRFHPDSSRDLHMAELQVRKRQNDEDWASFGDALRVLADKAYPDLEEKARERLALNQFLSQIEDSHLSFSVRQTRPKTVEAAVTTTIEMETYLGHSSSKSITGTVSIPTQQHSEPVCAVPHQKEPAVATVTTEGTKEMKLLVERLDRLEKLLQEPSSGSQGRPPLRRFGGRYGGRSTVTCWSCGGMGHIARNCPVSSKQQQQENCHPPVLGGPARGGEPVRTQNSVLTVPTLSVNCGLSYRLKGCIATLPIEFIIDTGAAVSLLRSDIWAKAAKLDSKLKLEEGTGQRLVGVSGIPLSIRGVGLVQLKFAEVPTPMAATFVIVDDLSVEAILGLDFLEQCRCVIDSGLRRIDFPCQRVSLSLDNTQQKPYTCTPLIGLVVKQKLLIPAESEQEIMVELDHQVFNHSWIVEGDRHGRHGLMVAHAVVSPSGRSVPLRVLNPRKEAVVVKKGTRIATMEALEKDPPGDEDLNVHAVSRDKDVPHDDQKALWEMVSKIGDHLSVRDKEMLFSVLLDYADVFSLHPGNIGRTGEIKHHLDTGDAQPIHQLPRRVPQARRLEVRKMLDEMLEKDVIQPSHSPWSSPIILVRKKDGSMRFCVDYRKVNSVTKKDAYPLPRVDDTLDTLGGTKFFSTLDLASGYWQVEVEEADRQKTAFTTPEGLFEFKVMPFGLCNAPATFQRLMDRVLNDLKWTDCLVYFDDIVVVGRTFSEHLHCLGNVLTRLRQAGLKLQPKKCNFCQQKVRFLGHVVSASGISTDPDKTEVVSNWPTPTDKREIQQFLGLVNYYRRFIKNFASLAKPLQRLTEKNVTFEWNESCQNAFDQLRACLVSAPVLAFPDYSKTFILDTDASENGIGAVLSQGQDDGSECVIAYASRSLSRQEQRYCVTRRELLAVVEFVHHFRCYLLGQHFTLRTDHGSLIWIQNFREPEGQLARWIERLQEYNFTVVHRPGIRHGNADALSRMPCRQCGRDSHNPTDDVSTQVGVIINLPFQSYPSEEMRKLQLADPSVGPVLQAVELDRKPHPDEVKSWSLEGRRLFQLWEMLCVRNGTLWRSLQKGQLCGHQLVIPFILRATLLNELHSGAVGGHIGEEKMSFRLKERFYWPGSMEAAREWCKTCASCATRKTSAPKNRAALQTVQAGSPMQIVAVDIMGPLPETKDGNRYVLVASDYFTRWVEVYAIPNQEAVTVAEKLVNEMFCRFSPPEQLHSDQGRQFESKLIGEVCKLLHIKKSRTTPYHPQCNGMVERFNRTLLDMLATTVNNQSDWDQCIRKLCMAYNSSVHSSTGYTPFYLMFGRQARLPVDLMYGTGPSDSFTAGEYATELRNALHNAYAVVREKCNAEHKRQKSFYDEKVHGKPYSVGDVVWLHSIVVPRGQSRKLHHPWKGPYRVQERIGESDYKIRAWKGKSTQVVHFDRLKPCIEGIQAPAHVPATKTRVTQNEESAARVPQPELLGEQLEIMSDDEEVQPLPEAQPPAGDVPVPPIDVPPPIEDPPVVNRRQSLIPRPTNTRYPQRTRRPPDYYGH